MSMTDIKQLLAAEFNLIKEEIIRLYSESGSNASGSTAQSIEVEVRGSSMLLTAAGYSDGRAPGRQPPSEAIARWIIAKGISSRVKEDIGVSALAYHIARKIGREGWKPKESLSEIAGKVITPQRMQQVMANVGEPFVAKFCTDTINFLKQIAA